MDEAQEAQSIGGGFRGVVDIELHEGVVIALPAGNSIIADGLLLQK